MKFKKIAAALLAAAVLVAAAPVTGVLSEPLGVTANAADTLTEGDYEYSVNEDGETVTITKYTGSDAEVEIPGSLGGKTVTVIGYTAFAFYKFLTSVTIPDSVTMIDSYAFSGSSLTNITIPNSVTTINSSAFSGCSFTSITLPNSLKTISSYLFDSCKLLTSVTIPNSVTKIEDYAFTYCTSLKSIEIPDSVTTIGDSIFFECISLETITVEKNNKNYSSIDGVLINTRESEIVCYPMGRTDTSYTIPENVTKIGHSAFLSCKSLTDVTFHSNLKTIGHSAFSYSSLKSAILPEGLTAIDDNAFMFCRNLKDVVIPNSVTTMESNAFSHTPITSIKIPNKVTTIDVATFNECEMLTDITIPESVTTIYHSVFEGCKSLKDVYFGGSKSKWEKINFGSNNSCLFEATIHFAKEDEEESDTSEPTTSDTSEPETSDTSEPETSDTSEPATSDTSEPETSGTSEPETSDTSEPATRDTSEPATSGTSEPTDPDLFIKENEVSTEIEAPTEAADIPESDRITSITINPAFNMKNKHDNNVELDLSKIKIKAEEIYDKEGLKRAEEALGETIKGNKHYNLLDLTLLYNGEDFSNGYEGLVKVIIPLPKGHRDKNFSCFRLTEVDGKMVKEVIPGEQTEDSYIIYLEHFSLYALVADANPDDGEKQPEESKGPEESAPIIPGDTDKNSGSNSGNDQANTGIALAIAPAVLACAAVIAASKKRK